MIIIFGNVKCDADRIYFVSLFNVLISKILKSSMSLISQWVCNKMIIGIICWCHKSANLSSYSFSSFNRISQLIYHLTSSMILILPPQVKKYSYLTSTETGILAVLCSLELSNRLSLIQPQPLFNEITTQRSPRGRPGASV